MRRFLFVFALLGFGLVSAGCGSTPTTAPPAPPADKDKDTTPPKDKGRVPTPM